MAKPKPRRVPSDDCEIEVDGARYNVHEGEWVEVMGTASVGDIRLTRDIQALQVQFEALEGEDDQQQRELVLTSDAFQAMIALLKTRVVDWSWTAMNGTPLPQPADDPEVFYRLSPEEVLYLLTAIRGETPGEQKNGSRPSRTTSSATRRRPSRA